MKVLTACRKVPSSVLWGCFLLNKKMARHWKNNSNENSAIENVTNFGAKASRTIDLYCLRLSGLWDAAYRGKRNHTYSWSGGEPVSHFLQFNLKPSIPVLPFCDITHGLTDHGGLWRTCWKWPQLNFATQWFSASRWKPIIGCSTKHLSLIL